MIGGVSERGILDVMAESIGFDVDAGAWGSDDPDKVREWEAARDVTGGVASAIVVAAKVSIAKENHAAAEGVEYPRGGDGE